MAYDNVPLLAFNRGIISKLALARTDIKRTALSAEVERNWMPRVLGSMMLRPGLGYVDPVRNNLTCVHLPFVFSNDDTAMIELTDLTMRVRIDEQLITRPAVATTVTSGDFSSATGWTDNDEAGGTSSVSGGVMTLMGSGFTRGIRTQSVSVAGGDQALEHALRIVVSQGPAVVRVGTTNGGDDLVSESFLGTGVHSLSFIPNTGTFYIQFSSARQYSVKLTQCQIEAAGVFSLPTPWPEASLRNVRFDQSADVVYLGAAGIRQQKIERRGTGRSWSLVDYLPESGPFRNINTRTITLAPSGATGDITLTASRALFSSTHVGALFKIESVGQSFSQTFTADNQQSGEVRVTGVGVSRNVTLTVTGTFTGLITIQRSIGAPGSWTDIGTVGAPYSAVYNDALDNQIVYYRWAVKAGNWTSGSADANIQTAGGSSTGIVRVTAYSSATSVSAIVLKQLGGTGASINWYEGEWSPLRGYANVPVLYEGRLFWMGKTKIIASVSDAYESFDTTVEGDSAQINRSIGRGPVDEVYWGLPLQRLLLGTGGSEWSVRSSSLDEPLTTTNFNLKDPSTQGSANVAAVKVDAKGLFVQKSGTKLYQAIYNGDTTFDYETVDLMELAPDVGGAGLVRIGVQRQPDTRIHCVRSDGLVAILVSEPAEDVLCWIELETDGFVEDVVVLPGNVEDKVYYVVRRTINGNTVRYLERWAMESECQGGLLNKQADSYIVYDGAATDTITGLGHLEGEQVVCWADGIDQGLFTVTGGQIVLDGDVSKAVVGLYYEARFKSAKLAYAAQLSTALSQKKKIDHLGLIMANTHCKGIKYGKTFETLEDLPEIINDIPVPPNTIFEDLDSGMFEFKGEWNEDSRLCLLAAAPRPCTLLAAIVGMKTNG